MSNSTPAKLSGVGAPASTPANPFKNPSYPQRVHLHERPELLAALKSCDDRIATFRQKLDVLSKHESRGTYERMFLQLQGARDQVADAARRLPLEAGALYEEDRERLQFALESFERIASRWSA